MSIAIARANEIQYRVENGYGETEVLPGVYPLVRGFKCVLKAGHDVKPEVYADKTAIYCFTGDGAVRSELQGTKYQELERNPQRKSGESLNGNRLCGRGRNHRERPPVSGTV